MALIASGINDSEVARRLGVARTTVRELRRRGTCASRRPSAVPAAGGPARPVRFDAADYAELLGLYLGDGYITPLPGRAFGIFLDARYVAIVDETEALLGGTFP